MLQPSLIAIKQPATEMGQVATELLIELIESEGSVTEFKTKLLKAELMIPDSSV